MIPLSEIINRVRVRYDSEAGGSATRFDDATVTVFINDGLRELAESTHFYERYCNIPIIEGHRRYDMRGFTPDTVVHVKSIWNTVSNRWLKPVDQTDLDMSDNCWEKASGDPFTFHIRGIFWLVVDPVPQASTGFLQVQFAGIPAPFEHAQNVLGDLPDDHVPALEAYTLYEMAAADRLTTLALSHWKDYQTREKALHDFVDMRTKDASAGRFGGVPGMGSRKP
jgi:hypothetical protein